MRAELNREIPIRVRVEAEDGTLKDADSLPTVVVTDGAGAVVAGVSAVAADGTGIYKAVIPPRSQYDRLDVTWTVVFETFTRKVKDRVEIIRERLVPYARLRRDDELSDASAYVLSLVSDAVESWFKRALHFPPVVESARGNMVNRYDTNRLHVPDVLYPVEMLGLSFLTGTLEHTYTPTEIDELYVLNDGFERNIGSHFSFLSGVRGLAPFPAGPYTYWLTHGLEDPPEDLRRAAAAFARHIARTSNYPERASRIITADTEIFFSMPSPDRPTGLPEVDAVITGYRIQALG